MNYWTGKGYGISDITDLTGRPLLTYQGPKDKKPFLISDRVAQEFDFTIQQNLTAGAMKNGRMDGATSSFIKKQMGGVLDDELDHKISLELGGSNAPANLMIQPGRTAGASAASDELENNLALDVVNGKISLLTAWRTLAEQKGFLLGEDSEIGTTFSYSQIASTIFEVAKTAYQGAKNTQLGKMDEQLKAQMNADIEKLKQNPLDQKLQTKIFTDNVTAIKTQLNATSTEAGGVVKSYLANYASNKGIDPRELMGSLNTNIQRIITNSKSNPNIFGVPSTIIIKIVAILQSTSITLVTGGIIAAIIGIFMAGPAVILGALSGGLLESIGAIFGVSALTGIGLTAFATGEALNVAAIGLNMSVKSMYDNGYLLPTQNLSALKDALAVQKGLAAFLPSEVKSMSATGTATPPVKQVKVFTGIVSQGTLGAATTFTPRENDLISSVAELKSAAENNLAPFLASLPSKILYEIKIVSHVTTSDGQKRVGTTQQIVSGYIKTGQPKYKTIINKFATLDIFILTDKKIKTRISSIVLGPTDSVKLQPKTNELATIETSINANLLTNNIHDITGIVTAKPITISAPITPAVIIPNTTTPVIPPAPQARLDNTFYLPRDGYSGVIYRVKDGVLWGLDVVNSLFNNEERVKLGNYGAQSAASEAKLSALGITINNIQRMQYFDTIPGAYRQANWTGSFNDFFNVMLPATATAPAKPLPAACQTQTLFEWYQSAGQNLPNISDRATLYEKFGLGIAGYYTGSAEQNTKLLNYLKQQSGCQI